ncbi:response regulator transcription factor [Lysobacter sp. KIS68-7]|uniref:response regulator transcription factor n=1 Tax=Lysobacter sp. KIS68-7 TaxID=2904252 RepID=UPI001E50B631|nr:response regulator transcription factor [Lysobacter sp. KIS68-7]UHQ20919.1 response regulator transcription factor [Lysobacter sp. KIS68-7]
MHRLVVADDHPIVSLALRRAMPARNHRIVAVCHDGHAALEAVRRFRPNLLVLDLHLPGLDGIAVLRQLRAERFPVNVLVLSCEDDAYGAARALRAGADGYACKRSSLADLRLAIATVAQGRRFFRTALPPAGVVVDDDALLGSLTEREFEMLKGLAAGSTNLEIGAALALSPKVVSAYRRKLMRKLGVTNLRDLIEFARANGI